jgi:hypothetical protein
MSISFDPKLYGKRVKVPFQGRLEVTGTLAGFVTDESSGQLKIMVLEVTGRVEIYDASKCIILND